jgi:hypothetical protein
MEQKSAAMIRPQQKKVTVVAIFQGTEIVRGYSSSFSHRLRRPDLLDVNQKFLASSSIWDERIRQWQLHLTFLPFRTKNGHFMNRGTII